MDEVLRRMSIVEGRLSEQDNDAAGSRIACSRNEGILSALQGRQVQLDSNVRYKQRETP